MPIQRRCVVASLLLWATAVSASVPPAAMDERVHALAEELRCLVCQNQTIADSTAPLALQLKHEIRAQLSQGATEQQVRDFMTQRYGDFVLYRPPLSLATALLWGGPVLLLLLGAWLARQAKAR